MIENYNIICCHLLRVERLYLPLCKVTDTHLLLQDNGMAVIVFILYNFYFKMKYHLTTVYTYTGNLKSFMLEPL